MKRFSLSCILTIALLSLVFLMGGCDANKPAGTKAEEAKIGVVNLEKVFAEAKAAKEGVKLLQSIQSQYEPRLKELQAKNKEDDTANKEFGELIGKYQSQMTSEQTRISALINEGMSKVLNGYIKKNGYKLIVSNDKALAFDESLDITPSIVQDLDALNIDVAAPKAPAPGVAPAPAPTPAPAPAPTPEAAPAPTPAPAEKPAQ